jgi:hypothetical protein
VHSVRAGGDTCRLYLADDVNPVRRIGHRDTLPLMVALSHACDATPLICRLQRVAGRRSWEIALDSCARQGPSASAGPLAQLWLRLTAKRSALISSSGAVATERSRDVEDPAVDAAGCASGRVLLWPSASKCALLISTTWR